MLILEINRLRKSIGDRLLLDIDRLQLYEGDRVGLVGKNGAGKSTLLELLAGCVVCDEGEIKTFGTVAYIRQMDADAADVRSGGEKTLARIDAAFASHCHFLLADEPTANLSLKRVEELTQRLLYAPFGLFLISHDRDFLNQLCNRIIELEDGRIQSFSGDYDFYREQKKLAEAALREAYNAYADEKERLTDRVTQLKQKAGGMKNAPKRMGNSEARLYKGSIKQRAGKVAKAAKIVEGRLNLLVPVKKPIIPPAIKIKTADGLRLHSKVAVEGRDVSVRFGKHILFEDANFIIPSGTKTALLGENGSGKTTLLRMILTETEGIHLAGNLKIAYFAQDLQILDENATILENVSRDSALNQSVLRSLLARMLFFREDVFKPVSVLSGGERVKVALCKIFSQNVNMLILDEPTNFLDLPAMEALEALIRDYDGCLLLATHDRSLMRLMDRLLILENKTIATYDNNYDEYTQTRQSKKDGQKWLDSSKY